MTSDRTSVSAMVAQAKLDVLVSGVARETVETVEEATNWEYLCQSDRIGARDEGSRRELCAWFAPGTLAQLRYLWRLIEQQSDPRQQRILTLVFSDVLFACASPGAVRTSSGKRRRHHWGWVADNVVPVQPIEHNAVRAFRSRLKVLAAVVRDDVAPALVMQQDARSLALSTASINMVVTSPPYMGVIDYTRANRLLYLWLNWPFELERAAEIGARFKRWRLAAVDDYLAEMRSCWREIHRVLRPGSYCAIVIGESRRFPETVEKTLADLQDLMPRVWGPTARQPSRRRVSDRSARAAVEYLCVFQKT